MYAVIETGGKQYRANVGDKFRVEKLSGETSTEIIFDKVIAVGGDGEARFGNP
ncbi:MAG: 50S ribosomal protein L21, partial [Synergistaceae bacterium]|nr:50S ribosomal protein L21 [Synergistaceae bacterium]